MLVATKGGHVRDEDASWDVNGRPRYLRQACEASLRRLGVDAIGLYQHHRPDPSVRYEDTMGGLKDLLDAGLVQRVGISNADPDQIRVARSVLGDGPGQRAEPAVPSVPEQPARGERLTSWASRSCPGARWAGPATQPGWELSTPPSRGSRKTTR